MSSWIDRPAVSVITKKKRMQLLKILEINEERDALVDALKDLQHLSRTESEFICKNKALKTKMERTKQLFETLRVKMTTKVFSDLLWAIGNYDICNKPELRDQMLDDYKSAGGKVTAEMLQEIIGGSAEETQSTSPCIESLSYDVIDALSPPTTEDEDKTHYFKFEAQICYIHNDGFSKDKPALFVIQNKGEVTDISEGSVHFHVISYDLINKEEIGKLPLIGHTGQLLHFLPYSNGRYCLLSCTESLQDTSKHNVQISLWSTFKRQLHCDNYLCDNIDKLSTCMIASELETVLVIFTQDSNRVDVYSIEDDTLEYISDTETNIPKLTAFTSITNPECLCAFWGGEEFEVFEVRDGLNTKYTGKAEGEISWCEFITCDRCVLLAVCYSNGLHDGTYSIDLWTYENQRFKMIIQGRRLKQMKFFDQRKVNTMFVEATCQLIVSTDLQYFTMTYDAEKRILTEEECENTCIAAMNSSYPPPVSHRKLMMSKDESVVYRIFCYDNNEVSITPISVTPAT